MLNHLVLLRKKWYARVTDLGKHVALFPFLFALYVILAPLTRNLQDLRPSQALRPLGALLVLAAAGLLLLRAVFRDGHYAAYLVFLALAFIFVFGHLSRVIESRPAADSQGFRLPLLLAWGGLLAYLGLRRTWLRFGGAGRVTPFLNFIVAVALFSQSIISTSVFLQPGVIPSQVEGAILPVTGDLVPLDCSSHPDIYYIILDAYGRSDVLDAEYGVDNSEFLASLERKGFYVASQSHSNYIQTVLSIPSALNFAYLAPEPPGTDGLEYFSRLIAENRLMLSLEKCGYRSMSLKSGFSFTNHLDVDVTLVEGSVFNDFENLLLASTPLELLAEMLGLQPLEYSYPAHRARVLFSFKELAELPHIPGPKVVFAHIVSPHPPFVFDADGRQVEPASSYTLNDGDEFGGSWEEYRSGYSAQVQFVDRKLQEAIDAILAGSSTPPIIILQGDHGPGGHLSWDSPEQSCLWERTSIFNAYYLPGGAQGLYSSITPVNSFRVVLNRFFGAELDTLVDQTFYSSQRHPRQIIDITRRRESTENCSSQK